jgi:hypothetical protein
MTQTLIMFLMELEGCRIWNETVETRTETNNGDV